MVSVVVLTWAVVVVVGSPRTIICQMAVSVGVLVAVDDVVDNVVVVVVWQDVLSTVVVATLEALVTRTSSTYACSEDSGVAVNLILKFDMRYSEAKEATVYCLQVSSEPRPVARSTIRS